MWQLSVPFIILKALSAFLEIVVHRFSPFKGMGAGMASERDYLTIIPRARMGSESIAHEAEGRMGY